MSESQPDSDAGELNSSSDGINAGGDAQSVVDDSGATEGKVNREARYRVERNEARAEVERLAGVVESLQRRAVEQIAEASGVKPAALWAARGNEDALAGLLDESGAVDVEAVAEACVEATRELGLQPIPRRPMPDPTQGTGGESRERDDDWVAAFG